MAPARPHFTTDAPIGLGEQHTGHHTLLLHLQASAARMQNLHRRPPHPGDVTPSVQWGPPSGADHFFQGSPCVLTSLRGGATFIDCWAHPGQLHTRVRWLRSDDDLEDACPAPSMSQYATARRHFHPLRCRAAASRFITPAQAAHCAERRARRAIASPSTPSRALLAYPRNAPAHKPRALPGDRRTQR